MKNFILLLALVGLFEFTLGQANETKKACQAVVSCFQDAEDEIDKCLSILIGEKSGAGTESPKATVKPLVDQGDCMAPIKEKIKQKKVLDQERVKDFKTCLNQRIEAGAEDVDPRKYRYCSTVTGRYLNKTAEAGNKKVKRQAQQLAEPVQAASNETVGIKNKSEPLPESSSTASLSSSLPSVPSSLSSAVLPAGEPKNATSGGGLEPSPPLANSTLLEITKKPLPSLPGEPSSLSSLPHSSEISSQTISGQAHSSSSELGQTQSGSQLGQTQSILQPSSLSHTQSTQLSGLAQTETTLLSGLGRTHSGLGLSQSTSGFSGKTSEILESTSQKPIKELPSTINGQPLSSQAQLHSSSIPEASSINGQPLLSSQAQLHSSSIPEASSSSQQAVTVSNGYVPSTTESEYEESGGSSSELGLNPALPAKPATLSPNPIVETLNLPNASEPLGPPLEINNATSSAAAIEVTTHSTTTIIGKVQPLGGAPGARSPGSRPNGHRPQRPVGAADIDAGASDQDNQQRVKVELLRETRRRLSEFKGCMARARIKREECKPLVRCCPDTAICHLNYEASDLHDKVHKLESEIVQGRQECIKQKRSKDESTDALDQIDAEELISDDSVVSQAIF